MNWFEAFDHSLKTADSQEDLIPAGSLNIQEALEQYRYQYFAKIRESIEESFPVLKMNLDETWEELLQDFLSTRKSFRSLDWYPKAFEDYYIGLHSSIEHSDLCRFEGILDRFSWTHRRQAVIANLQFQEDSILKIGEYELETFQTNVIDMYEEKTSEAKAQEIIIWMKNSETHFREISPWEKTVLENLARGQDLGSTLSKVDRPQVEISDFFQWLGGSGLIR